MSAISPEAASPRSETAPGRSGFGELLRGPGLVAILLWGASFPATQDASDGFTPAGLVALRLALGAAFVMVVQLARRKQLLPERADRPRCVLIGTILGLHLALQAFAIQATTAQHAGWIVPCSAVLVTLGAAAFLGERLSMINAAGVGFAALGVALVLSTQPPELEHATAGDLWMLASSISWASYTLLSKRPAQRSGAWRVTPLVLATASAVATLVTFATPAFGAAPGFTTHAPPLRAVLAIVFLGVGSSGIALTAWSRTIERFGALRAGSLLYLQPFVTQALAVLYHHERAHWTTLVGGPIVLVGVACASRR